VDDLLQETLIKTYENLGSLKDKSSIKSWLFQIANHSIIDFYRKEGRSRDLKADDLWYTVDAEEIQLELSQCIEPFINALPARSAQLLTAIDLEGKSQKDYALEQNISYSTLKSQVQKGRSELRNLWVANCYFTNDIRELVVAAFCKQWQTSANCLERPNPNLNFPTHQDRTTIGGNCSLPSTTRLQ